METISLILFVLAAIVGSSVIGRILPIPVPMPLIQIALGVCISMTTSYSIALEPHLFFLLFLPPLLFLDGWRIPKDQLFQDKIIVSSLALGLVVSTVLGAGLFIHWLIPAMPLAVAFALAAMISPTDPVAVSAIAARTPLPKRLMHILEGESLLNDASGLVCMRFAVAAVLTGTFSLVEAIQKFIWLAGAGLAIGVGTTIVITIAKNAVIKKLSQNTGAQILISVLMPFVSYILAEHFGASGILAAVSAGIAMGYAEYPAVELAVTRIHRKAVWDTIYFAASGATFIILGEQLPELLDNASGIVEMTGHQEDAWIVFYILAINIFISATRFIWVKIALSLSERNARKKGDTSVWQTWRMTGIMTLAGVRGTVTLAGIMTLPLLGAGNEPFPARDLAILLAAGVIIVSLILASVGLPYLIKGLNTQVERKNDKRLEMARIRVSEAAIKAIEGKLLKVRGNANEDIYIKESSLIVEFYRDRIKRYIGENEVDHDKTQAHQVRLKLLNMALDAERAEVRRLAKARSISDDMMRKLIKDIDLIEERFLSGV